MEIFREMDDRVSFMTQLNEATEGPVVLINTFHVDPQDVDQMIEVWAEDAAIMKKQPGFISTQLHRGVAGSSTLVNVAMWDSAASLRDAFTQPEFQATISWYPQSTTASPHLFTKVAVPGICDG